MIGYEGVTIQDFALYFSNVWVWHYDAKKDSVSPFVLVFPDRDEDGDFENEYAEDCEFYLSPLLPNQSSFGKSVYGRVLTAAPEYILHRFDLEYVPVGPHSLVRVCFEPMERRACKGIMYGHATTLPLLDLESGGAQRLPDIVRLLQHCTMLPAQATVAAGIANVLSIGLAPCMGRLFAKQERIERAKNSVRQLFAGDSTVCVPTFSTALVRRNSTAISASVLHRGRLIGEVLYDGGRLVYHPDISSTATREARKVLREGYSNLATGMFADEVVWSATSH